MIDSEMKKRGLEYIFYETSAATGHNLMKFLKQFGMCAHAAQYNMVLF